MLVEQLRNQLSSRVWEVARTIEGLENAVESRKGLVAGLIRDLDELAQTAREVRDRNRPRLFGRIARTMVRAFSKTSKLRDDLVDSLIGDLEGLAQRTREGHDRAESALRSEFDETTYLTLHPDVAEAVARGDIPSGYHHWRIVGRSEGRAIR